MTTIHPLGLAQAIDNHESFELLDVRSRQEFERVHIRGARSVPLRALQPARLLRARGLANNAPLFLISGRRASASLAAGMLEAAGCVQPVVVEGGMQLWEAQGLRVVRPLRRHLMERARRLGQDLRRRMPGLHNAWREAVGTVQHALRPRSQDNGWWCRYEFQVREAYRG